MISSEKQAEQVIKERTVARKERVKLPSLGLAVSERRLLLGVVDVALICLALIMAVRIRTDLTMNIQAIYFNLKWFVTLVVVWVIVAGIFDIYDLARSAAMGSIFWASSAAVVLTGILYLAIPWLTPPLENRSYGFLFISVSLILVVGWRLLYSSLFIQPAFQRRALVIGAGRAGRDLIKALREANDRIYPNPFMGTGHEILGLIDDDPNRHGQVVEGVPVVGGSSRLPALVEELDIDEVVIAITNTQMIQPRLFAAILGLREQGLPIVTMPTIYERLTGRVAVEHISQNIELASGLPDSPFFRMYGLSKRVIDIVLGVIGLVIMVLLVPVIALVNLIDSPGPLFFKQNRLGKGGREFRLIKFRSMVPNAEESSGAVWASEQDTRITKVGRWLRLTHIDELPQVVNVLRGEMSIVGPRPERPEFVDDLSQSIPFYRLRHSVRPGITGWAQIHQDYGGSLIDAKEKLEYDLYYLKRAGPRIDAVILLRTVTKVFGFKGR